MVKKLLILKKKTSLTLGLLFIAFVGIAQTQTFTSNGTFTVPAGVTSVTVEVWGGGGKGGTRTMGTFVYSGGGGGGAYAKKTAVTVVPGTAYTVTVGTGSTTTAAGGDSWFINITTILAKGGSSGANDSSTGANGGAAGSCIGDTTYSGGNGANGSSGSSYGGGGGSSAGTSSIGTNATNATGATAPAGGGNGGNGRSGTNGNGTDGISPGGGGGGALRTSANPTGGIGANGQVKITWVLPQEINIQGNATTIVDGDITPTITDWTDFGSTQILSTPITKIFTIQNTGGTTLTIGAISFSGTNTSDFTVTTAPSASVAAGSSTTFVVTFNPSAAGTRTAAISVVNNDSDENPYDFALQGTGTQTFFDSDGDGIYDNIDIDDDNDGILDASEETNCNNSNGYKVNYKFLNETFGAGTRTTINTTYAATTTYCYADGTAGTNTADCPTLSDYSLNDGEYTVGSSAQIATWAASY